MFLSISCFNLNSAQRNWKIYLRAASCALTKEKPPSWVFQLPVLNHHISLLDFSITKLNEWTTSASNLYCWLFKFLFYYKQSLNRWDSNSIALKHLKIYWIALKGESKDGAYLSTLSISWQILCLFIQNGPVQTHQPYKSQNKHIIFPWVHAGDTAQVPVCSQV